MRKRREREMEREMRFHLEREAVERRAEGAGEAEARRAAALAFGSVEGWKDEARAARGGWSELWWRDARLAWRGLRRAPGFALLAVTVLALGIGANTAMFSVVQAVLLNPLPYANPQGLMYIGSVYRHRAAGPEGSLSYPDFLDVRRTPGVGRMAAYATGGIPVTGIARPERVPAAAVSTGLFDLLHVRPEAGRAFLPGDGRPGALAGADPIVLSDARAREWFGGAQAALAKKLTLNGQPGVVIGVMPAGFQFPLDQPEDLWATFSPFVSGTRLQGRRGARWVSAIVRLEPGETPMAARQRLGETAARLRHTHPVSDADRSLSLTPMLSEYTGRSRPVLWLLLAATGSVLLIACLNVGGLLLARGARRRPEFALRFALGASRGAVLRQLTCEGGLLGLLGAGAGLGVAQLALAALLRLAPQDVARLGEARLNVPVLLFTLATGVAAGAAFALLQAASLVRAQARRRLGREVVANGRGAPGGGQGWRRGVLIAQFGLTLAALFVAGLLLHSFQRLAAAPLGFAPGHILTATVSLPERRYPTPGGWANFFGRLTVQLGERAPVAVVAAVDPLPFDGTRHAARFDHPSSPLPEARQPQADFLVTTPGYFRALAIPLLRGRDFSARDTRMAVQVAIVNQAFALRYFAGHALGRRITPAVAAYSGRPPARKIVGVVGDTLQAGPAVAAPPIFYLPESQAPMAGMTLIVRPRPGAEREAAGAIAVAMARLDPGVPAGRVAPMRARLSQALAPARFDALLLGLFAGLALALSALGLYAMMTQAVALRRREIGIRLALGADRAAVTGMILRDAMVVAGAGAATGVALTLGLSRLLNAALGGVLYRVSSLDPMALAGALALLLLVAVAATAAPARRAAKADPVAALRLE